ncbi:MAG: AI-2E family transporter, partial [Patescibacteria group bacterium]
MEVSNGMNNQKSELYFLLIILVGIFILAFFVFKPFLYTLILAIIFATVFEPVHKHALVITRGRSALSALLATISVLIVIIMPLIFLGVQIFQEATQLYSSLVSNGGATDLSRNVSDIIQSLMRFSPVPIDSLNVNEYLKQGLSWLLQHLGPLFASFVKVVVGIFIFLIAIYYLFKDGHKLKTAIIILSPLQDIHDET